MKFEGGGHYLRAANDGARTVYYFQSIEISVENLTTSLTNLG